MKQQKCQISWMFSVFLVLIVLNLGTQAGAQSRSSANVLLLTDQISNSQASTTSARELFRNAYENRYTWNQKFPGYAAGVELKQGKEHYKGHVRVNSNMTVEVTGINDENARKAVENRLRMLIIHRRQVPFEVAHKTSTFRLGTTDRSGAVEIFEKGDKIDAHYKVFRQQLMQVNRLLGPHAVTVDVLDSEVTPEGYLATRYRTIFRQPQTKQVVGEMSSEDAYQKIGSYYLPTRQVTHEVEGNQQITTELNFTDLQLLSDNG